MRFSITINDELSGTVTDHFEDKDNRRDKDYWSRVSLRAVVDIAEGTPWQDWGYHNLQETIMEVFDWQVERRIQCWDFKDGGRRKLSVLVPFPRHQVDKPSKRLNPEELWEKHDMHDCVTKLTHALSRSRRAYLEEQSLGDVAAQATAVRDWSFNNIVKTAKANCRYEQRLAALKAELLAELKVQVQEMVPAQRKELEDADLSKWRSTPEAEPVTFDRRAIDIGLLHSRRMANDYNPDPFRLSHSHVTVEDIKKGVE